MEYRVEKAFSGERWSPRLFLVLSLPWRVTGDVRPGLVGAEVWLSTARGGKLSSEGCGFVHSGPWLLLP